ncbi:MAG: T9SS type A sorting domain-containing protein [Ignavibacterium sp.]|nr:T9SS type A sorting domain-containing protein [Ignavibacterium sp.]
MNKIKHYTSFSIFFLLLPCILFAQNYPDQQYVIRTDSIFTNIETNQGIVLSTDGKSIMLQEGINDGYVILKPQYSQSPFNEGLPSWNGSAPNSYSSFKVQMRFPYNGGWSPWLTVGFWKSNIWGSYGTLTYGGGYIDYDNVKLNSYQSAWQFKIIMTRTSSDKESPTINKLSFFISDSRTTNSVNLTSIVNDNPEAIFIPTQFVYQYGVDPVIGPDICSPTSVSMILKSYNIEVDPYQFAVATRDPYFNMFGMWPRVVQNASEYGLDGAVTRYRSWSEVRDVLANGGRISMSVGSPLYPVGHLLMIAGFTSDGKPIVHDSAKPNGYSYVYNKTSLSQSWFVKGGVAYTFYLTDSATVSVENSNENMIADDYILYQNYPNPFNPSTTISFSIPQAGQTKISVYDMLGTEVEILVNQYLEAGLHQTQFNAKNLASGIYIYRIESGNFTQAKRMILLK